MMLPVQKNMCVCVYCASQLCPTRNTTFFFVHPSPFCCLFPLSRFLDALLHFNTLIPFYFESVQAGSLLDWFLGWYFAFFASVQSDVLMGSHTHDYR